MTEGMPHFVRGNVVRLDPPTIATWKLTNSVNADSRLALPTRFVDPITRIINERVSAALESRLAQGKI